MTDQRWALQRSGSTDPPKENGRKFAPTAPIASKFRLGITRLFFVPFVILRQDSFALRANQRPQISAIFPVWSHRLRFGLNSALALTDSDTAWDSNYSHSGWETVSCSRWHNRKTTGARDWGRKSVLVLNILTDQFNYNCMRASRFYCYFLQMLYRVACNHCNSHWMPCEPWLQFVRRGM